VVGAGRGCASGLLCDIVVTSDVLVDEDCGCQHAARPVHLEPRWLVLLGLAAAALVLRARR